ncbi:MAG: sulfite exporter TauE/SafE family protein [Clostridiaceae bacterium]|nr:sulfite exporter TauE/SafE family protein [Clostridiales bacterium]MDD6877763.1 sulfite exporter TauE/SafE family protein [Clostridiaceae bacterium]MDY3071949.1 sulfite exporter TauE/SafE family protein [Eubacteriales bacterium]MDY3286249.1 sulfite exporter TauE/SafE family protein [Eubacteriales bacterium]MDY5014725.1 sulfite exporter TauE/SafE family protein [Eubacteriales bacterium]
MPDTVSPCAKFLLAAATGVLSGFGIGGGTLLVIALVFLFGVEQRAAQGANLWYFFPTAAASLAVHAKKNRIAWRVFLPAAAAGVLAALLSSRAAGALEGTLLRRLFGLLLAYTGVRELFAGKK